MYSKLVTTAVAVTMLVCVIRGGFTNVTFYRDVQGENFTKTPTGSQTVYPLTVLFWLENQRE